MKRDNNSIKLKQLFDFIKENRLNCPICDSKRKEVELGNMSSELRKEFKETVGILGIKEKSALLYCGKCNKYTYSY